MYNNLPQYARCRTNLNIPFVPSQPAMLGLTRATSIVKPLLCFSYGYFKGWRVTIL
ncbi:hypothetical protein IMY05_018G0017600 [Salix suchowensis]|nr:hypothetical protein IMY05_018G0017600 [Salix suchowensis]